MKTYLVLDIPVLHQGYIQLFEKHAGTVSGLFVLDKKTVEKFRFFEKEIRAMDPAVVVKMIKATDIFKTVALLDSAPPRYLATSRIITTKDHSTKQFIKTHLAKANVIVDSAFLRWDVRHVSSAPVVHYDTVSNNPFDKKMVALAMKEAEQSSDWWRQVGALLVRDKRILLREYNTPVPHPLTPYVLGDIRDYIPPGKKNDISGALHAEQALITKAAKKGISLQNTHLYVTTFPCAICAKLIAYSGISKCFFASGHATFDGEQILKSNSVELVYVDTLPKPLPHATQKKNIITKKR